MDNKKENFTHEAGFFGWKPAAWLRVTGGDSFTFLQGQFTNELRGLEVGAAVYGLWLNHKGRVLADSFVVRGREKEEFWVGSYFSKAEAIRERLEAFIIADDVVVEELTAEWLGVSAIGEAERDEDVARAVEGAGGFRFRGRRAGEVNWECVLPVARADAVMALVRCGRRALSEEEVERLRIADAIPAVPRDLGPGELPNEGGLESSAISYTKGCYLGQEVMARLKSMGQVRRRLARVRGSGAAPVPPVELFQGGRRLGELRSAVSDEGGAGFVGLALVSLLNLQREQPLSYSAGGDGAVEMLDRP